MNVRLLRPDTDFPRVVEIISADQPTALTVGQLTAWHENMPPGRICRRWVATESGDVIGYGVAAHEAWSLEGHFYLWVIVDPTRRSRGAGTALYLTALEFALANGATRLASEARDDSPRSLRFAEARGFAIESHSFELGLDIAEFDARPYQHLVDDLRAHGFEFCSLADFGDTEEARRRLYEINYAAIKDIPGSDGNWLSFPEFIKTVCGSDWYRPDGQLVVVKGDEWVGMAAVQLVPQRQEAYNAMTGVMRPYRGMRIGLALKVLAIEYCRRHGARMLRTNNDSENAPMLAINRRLGYRPLPGKFILQRQTMA